MKQDLKRVRSLIDRYFYRLTHMSKPKRNVDRALVIEATTSEMLRKQAALTLAQRAAIHNAVNPGQ